MFEIILPALAGNGTRDLLNADQTLKCVLIVGL